MGVSQSRSGQDKVNDERVSCRWWTEGTHPCHRTWNLDGTTREESGVYIQAGKWRPPGRLFLAMWVAVVTEEVSGGCLPTRSSKVPCRVPGSQPSGRGLSRIQKEK